MSGPLGFDDASRRASDTIRQAIVDGYGGRWITVRLDDNPPHHWAGQQVGAACYESRAAAVKDRGHYPREYMYVKVPWDDCTPRAAGALLRLARQARDIGADLVDPEVRADEWMHDQRRETLGDIFTRRPGVRRPGNGRLWTPGQPR